MKRSRRVILTMMGTAAVGAVSMGFVRCPPGHIPATGLGPDGRLREGCRLTWGGFGSTPYRIHGHGHVHGGS